MRVGHQQHQRQLAAGCPPPAHQRHPQQVRHHPNNGRPIPPSHHVNPEITTGPATPAISSLSQQPVQPLQLAPDLLTWLGLDGSSTEWRSVKGCNLPRMVESGYRYYLPLSTEMTRYVALAYYEEHDGYTLRRSQATLADYREPNSVMYSLLCFAHPHSNSLLRSRQSGGTSKGAAGAFQRGLFGYRGGVTAGGGGEGERQDNDVTMMSERNDQPSFVIPLCGVRFVNNLTERGPCFNLDARGGIYEFSAQRHDYRNLWNAILVKAGCRELIFTDLYSLTEYIGEGSFGKVYVAKEISSEDEKIVKAVPTKDVDSSNIQAEINILSRIDHPYIAKLYGAYEQENYVCLVMEYLRGGEVYDFIQERGAYPEHVARVAIWRILLALKCLHSLNIVHRDLKTENLILEDECDGSSVKVIDFGLACHTNNHNKMNMRCGSPGYVAPEILENRAYTTKVDIFSAGVIFYIMLKGSPPFASRRRPGGVEPSRDDEAREILQQNLRCEVDLSASRFPGVSPQALDLLHWMLKRDPDTRASADLALDHLWFRSTDLPHLPPPFMPTTAGGEISLSSEQPSQPIVDFDNEPPSVMEICDESDGWSGMTPFTQPPNPTRNPPHTYNSAYTNAYAYPYPYAVSFQPSAGDTTNRDKQQLTLTPSGSSSMSSSHSACSSRSRLPPPFPTPRNMVVKQRGREPPRTPLNRSYGRKEADRREQEVKRSQPPAGVTMCDDGEERPGSEQSDEDQRLRAQANYMLQQLHTSVSVYASIGAVRQRLATEGIIDPETGVKYLKLDWRDPPANRQIDQDTGVTIMKKHRNFRRDAGTKLEDRTPYTGLRTSAYFRVSAAPRPPAPPILTPSNGRRRASVTNKLQFDDSVQYVDPPRPHEPRRRQLTVLDLMNGNRGEWEVTNGDNSNGNENEIDGKAAEGEDGGMPARDPNVLAAAMAGQRRNRRHKTDPAKRARNISSELMKAILEDHGEHNCPGLQLKDSTGAPLTRRVTLAPSPRTVTPDQPQDNQHPSQRKKGSPYRRRHRTAPATKISQEAAAQAAAEAEREHTDGSDNETAEGSSTVMPTSHGTVAGGRTHPYANGNGPCPQPCVEEEDHDPHHGQEGELFDDDDYDDTGSAVLTPRHRPNHGHQKRAAAINQDRQVDHYRARKPIESSPVELRSGGRMGGPGGSGSGGSGSGGSSGGSGGSSAVSPPVSVQV
ncbi:unnamed protein product [Vitrella brassicaformis CCMP3155]|uniref:Protein kinase domain-containing protein n=4 Tax=Vitrella brassicaformis TaxID=1169539 RepID=A0A0G4GY79_VITBC|nr:unnamed protein product [Vitrella brassicaformis CCMP3155]|eukprot:CEM36020.1 unnamed protein product [Vitrella brassicaformis CCMP3155]